MDMYFHKAVNIPVGKITIHGELIIPLKANAIIIFSQGRGSSRFSKRNQMGQSTSINTVTIEK